ncbi:MAG: GTPase HflX [Melioribacteraceae bacterium]|jgi:GTP-binding protein HflX|nr:GTPase HflX [Melioribacteraceae bacterium]
MLDVNVKKMVMERAMLVAIKQRNETKFVVEEHLDELEMLADTAGAETILKVIQDRPAPDKAYYVGKGKVEELAELVELNEIVLVIFDGDLSPTQVRNLEKLLDIKIIDRSGLILDIFASHAKTKQAKTQVELAQLQYMLPRLTRAWTHLSKQHGGIGTKGPGETQIETDRRLIRTRISKLKEVLVTIDKQDITKSLNRQDFLKASLVGYTNAGKSTFLNLLTDADVLAENKLFATLDSTTRSFELEKDKKVLISDTVGFIRKLPHNLVASFKSTLNVVKDADIILHVIDISHPFYEDHIKVVEETLEELGCKDSLKIKLFNKIDVLEDKDRISYVKNKYDNSILISAERAINISEVKQELLDIYENNYRAKEIILKSSQSKLVAQIHSMADVLTIENIDEDVKINYKANKAN